MARRRQISEWEIEARNVTDSLRAALASMSEVEKALVSGSMTEESLAGTLNDAHLTASFAAEWIPAWRQRAGGGGPENSLPFFVFDQCLPAVIHSVDVCRWSLGLLAISPDVHGGDGEIAEQALSLAKKVSLIAS
jgi:hypothetical protein